MFAHAQVYAEMCSHKCGGPGAYFGGLRMCLRYHSRDCAGQKHLGERVLPPCTYVPSYECEGPGEQLGFAAF